MGVAMKAMTGEQRKQLIDEIMALQSGGELTLGMAVRRLRLEITGFDQETFAQMCGMSTRALYQLETDKGNPTLSTIDSILRKFGLRMGIISATASQKKPPLVTTLPSRRPALAGKPNGVPDVDKYSDTSRDGALAKSRGSKPKGLVRRRPKLAD
jgi:DNA-binding phage protein